ncbi:MAG: TRAM domain-containing protein [Desulfurococcaceae archaeon]
MAKHERKRQWDPYTSDIQKLSIYPKISTREEPVIKVGDLLEVNVYDVDEADKGIVYYKGYKIIIPNAISGSRVKVKIVKVQGNIALGHVVSVLSESGE